MSTTQEPEINFHEQINELIRCFKYLDILKKTVCVDTVYIRIDSLSGSGNTKLTKKSGIIPDTEAKLLTKGKVSLVPARLQFNFECDHITELKCEPASVPLDSNIIKALTANTGKGTLAESFLAWNAVANIKQVSIDLNNLDLPNLSLNLKWKVYHLANSEEVADILYVHFPTNDSWVALRFHALSDESEAIQILNEYEGYIVDCHDLKYHYRRFSAPGADDYSKLYNLDPQLDNGALFALSKVEQAADELVANFKGDQEDPYIDSDELEGSELNFLCGSEDNLERMITLICHAAIPMDAWKDSAFMDIEVYSATDDGEAARVDWDNMSYNSWGEIKDKLDDNKCSYIDAAFDASLVENTPSGYTWEYNDGPYDRQSGYDKSPQRLTFTVTSPSAHEQICAKIEIKKLVSILGKANIKGLLE